MRLDDLEKRRRGGELGEHLAFGDPEIAAEFRRPRSMAFGWMRSGYGPVVTADVLDMVHPRPQAEVLKLRRRARMLSAIVRLLVALLRALDVRLHWTRLLEGTEKAMLTASHRPHPARTLAPGRSARPASIAVALPSVAPGRATMWAR